MIVFESDYVLKQCLEQIYPFASQILIAEGPVQYWQQKGRKTSLDGTNAILESFPDPENKIKVVRGQWKEKGEQSNAYMKHLAPDTDYLWMVDADEIYKTGDIKKTIDFLQEERPNVVSVKLITFYGGFERYLTGFEQRFDCRRIFKVTKGATWANHRPPTIKYIGKMPVGRIIGGDEFLERTGVYLYHYSYLFPTQVDLKLGYYKAAVSKDNCIDNYFEDVYLRWMAAENKMDIESIYQGVHEFKVHARGDCYTELFDGTHPEAIERDFDILNERIKTELKKYTATATEEAWKSSRSIFEKQCSLNVQEYNAAKWPQHWYDYLHFMNMVNATSVLDIGCGSGVYKQITGPIKYVGADYSPDAIDIAQQMWGGDFRVMDYRDLTSEFISGFDVVHMGGFLDVLPNADDVLRFILSLSPKAVIIGRMEVVDGPSHYTTYRAYDEITTFRFYHSRKIFERITAGWVVTKRNNSYLITSHRV